MAKEEDTNTDTITLGGGIELNGFKDIEPGMFIVIKKIVGSYTRAFSDKHKDFEKLILNKTEKEMNAELKLKGKSFKANSKVDNLFIALDAVLKELENKSN